MPPACRWMPAWETEFCAALSRILYTSEMEYSAYICQIFKKNTFAYVSGHILRSRLY